MAAAPLLTTRAASAPHARASRRAAWADRLPRVAGVEVELEVGVAGRSLDGDGGPPQVGVEQDPGGVDDRLQQAPLHGRRRLAGSLERRRRVAAGDRSAMAARATSTSSGVWQSGPASSRRDRSTDGGRPDTAPA